MKKFTYAVLLVTVMVSIQLQAEESSEIVCTECCAQEAPVRESSEVASRLLVEDDTAVVYSLVSEEDESLAPVAWDVNYSPVTKELVEAIKAYDTAKALELISTMSQQELHERDTTGSTLLMIAIKNDGEAVALRLVECMSCESFFVKDMEGLTAFIYAINCMREVAKAMFYRLEEERRVVIAGLRQKVENLEESVKLI